MLEACLNNAGVPPEPFTKPYVTHGSISGSVGMLSGDRLIDWRRFSCRDGLVSLENSVVVDHLPDGQPPKHVQHLLLGPGPAIKATNCPSSSQILIFQNYLPVAYCTKTLNENLHK